MANRVMNIIWVFLESWENICIQTQRALWFSGFEKEQRDTECTYYELIKW